MSAPLPIKCAPERAHDRLRAERKESGSEKKFEHLRPELSKNSETARQFGRGCRQTMLSETSLLWG
jgi:hypothetical protein